MFMRKYPELIVMLTYNDQTVENAFEIFEQCKNSKANFFGLKEKGLPLDEIIRLFAYMKQCGKTTILEVVKYTEKECLAGAKIAAESMVDILMGTVFFDSVNDFCIKNNLKYIPFVGQVSGRPSVLNGYVDEMIAEASNYLLKGVYGIDLLGYRYTGHATTLNEKFIARVNTLVCLAGNVNSYERLDEIIKANPWAFTIGSAFYESKFGTTYSEQIDKVCNYIKVKV